MKQYKITCYSKYRDLDIGIVVYIVSIMINTFSPTYLATPFNLNCILFSSVT